VHVATLTAYHVRIPLRRSVRHASHERTSTDNLIVRCTLNNGTVGWGEGVPREYVTGESIESVISLLRASDLNKIVIPVSAFADVPKFAEQLPLATVSNDDRGIRGNAARCALEMAILDAFCRHFGVPLGEITQLVAPKLFLARDKVRYSGIITSSNGWKLRLVAWGYRVYGFNQIKLKVGIPGLDDFNRLKLIRKRVGLRVRLRVDANEAWRPAEASKRIKDLESFGICSVEQPVAHEEAGALPELRRQISTPVMLDESLCGLADARRAVRDNLCDQFNLRLSKCGGFLSTLKLAELARQNNIGCQLGCQVGETAILSAAGRHFASSVRDLTAVEGSYDRHLVRESLVSRDISFGWGGWAPALTGPGLGIDVDAKALARVTIREEHLLG
jgi:L-Ala-D/L-Glu epimerase / N-acetyl-D-glutamate racemase